MHFSSNVTWRFAEKRQLCDMGWKEWRSEPGLLLVHLCQGTNETTKHHALRRIWIISLFTITLSLSNFNCLSLEFFLVKCASTSWNRRIYRNKNPTSIQNVTDIMPSRNQLYNPPKLCFPHIYVFQHYFIIQILFWSFSFLCLSGENFFIFWHAKKSQ